jgi:ABC-2 type transport system ATP-binding protein
MIQTVGLTKKFGRHNVVDDLDLDVPAGSVLGLIGPNGSGKTTIMKMLLGLVRPTSGRGLVMHHDIEQASRTVRQLTAYVPDDKSVYAGMRVEQFLRFYLDFFPDASLNDAMDLLRKWNIDPRQKTHKLSRGSRLKVLFAAVFARGAPVLLLDEPTEGLDPAGAEDVLLELMRNSEDMTTIFATHRLEDVERVCDRVAIINRGTVLVNTNLDDLRASWKRVVLRPNADAGAISRIPHLSSERRGSGVTLTTSSFDADLLAQPLVAEVLLEVLDMNLREIYLTVTSTGYGSRERNTKEAADDLELEVV